MQRITLGSYAIKFMFLVTAPYTSSVNPTIVKLEALPSGEIICVQTITEKPWLRNPFKCVHAVALVNLGEATSGLAMLSYFQRAEQKGLRGIVTGLDCR